MSTRTPSTSLTEATAELRRELIGQIGSDALSAFDRDAEAMGEGDAFNAAPGVGATAPLFTLPDARGGEVALADVLSRGSVVLVFYRGAWCPYCNLQLAAYQGALDEIRAAGAELVAVSPQTPDQSLTFAEQRALAFAVLSDAGNRVARAYGLEYTASDEATATLGELGVELPAFNGDDSNTLPAPSTFVIGQDGRIRFASVSGDYRWRVGPEEVLDVLRG